MRYECAYYIKEARNSFYQTMKFGVLWIKIDQLNICYLMSDRVVPVRSIVTLLSIFEWAFVHLELSNIIVVNLL